MAACTPKLPVDPAFLNLGTSTTQQRASRLESHVSSSAIGAPAPLPVKARPSATAPTTSTAALAAPASAAPAS